MNTIVARAINRANSETTASLSISLDSTPPHVAITSPPNGYKSAESSITVTGIINDIVRGTVNEAQGNVLVNGREAQISNRNFIVENVPLDRGENTITAVGADAWGNISSTNIKVFYDNTPRNTISIVSGNNQTGPVGTVLPQPLVIEVKDDKGRPIENMLAIFRIKENNGNLFAAGYDGRATSAWTDANGRAQATLTLGTWAGAGNNRVRVTSAGVDGEVMFTATGTTKPPASIYVGQGNQQRGAINGLLPEPLVAYVTDEGHNPLGNVPIIFRAVAGGGSFPNGQDSITINSDSDGRATTAFILGPIPGNDGNIIEANFEGNTNQPAGFTATGLITGDPGNTKITGVVLDNSNQPIAGVTMRVEGTTREAVTDSQGQFSIANVPVGPLHLVADGTTAGTLGAIEYPVLKYALTTIAGANNTVGMPIYLVPLDLKNAKTVGREDVVYTLPEVPGFELTIKKNSVTFPDGSKEGKISVTQVHGDKVPMVPQIGQQPNLIVTIQPPGAVFDPPAPLTIPNIDGLKPGEKTNMYSFDHDLGIFVSIGTGTVSEDGMVIKSDPGVGVVKAGWHCGGNPAPAGSANNCPPCQKVFQAVGPMCLPYTGSYESNPCKKCTNGTPENAPGLCDDGIFCTYDYCEGGVCKSEAKPEEKLGSINKSFNLAVFEPVKQILSLLGVGAPQLNLSFTGEEWRACCELKKADVTNHRGIAEGNTKWTWGPSPIPGLSVTLGVATFGFMGSGDITAGLSANVLKDLCADRYCWDGNGQISLNGSLNGGGLVKDGDTNLVQATINGNTGLQGVIGTECEKAKLVGTWNGITVSATWDVFDGFSHFEATIVLVQPVSISYEFMFPGI